LIHQAPGGVYELLATELVDLDQIISRTSIPNLDIVVSNDYWSQLQQLLLNAPNGRYRLISLLDQFSDRYDAIIIDTRGLAPSCSRWPFSPLTTLYRPSS